MIIRRLNASPVLRLNSQRYTLQLLSSRSVMSLEMKATHNNDDAAVVAPPLAEAETTDKEEPAPLAAAAAAAAAVPLPVRSKSQMKRQRRYEQAMERKKRRKQQEKEIKRAKAVAQGRDVEEEQRLHDQRTKEGTGAKRRQDLWLQKIKSADTSFRVCLDCAYNDQLTYKELNSLALQIRYCYSTNRKSDHPLYFSVSGLEGTTLELLNKVEGFPDQWAKRAFEYTDKSLLHLHPNKEKLVYLSSDSQHTLTDLDNDKTYVIGGIVDRNRLKRAAMTQAETLGISTAKLPITQYFDLVSTKVLTCNHVFEILLQYKENGGDWKQAMLDVLPTRKEVHAKEEDEEVAPLESTEAEATSTVNACETKAAATL